MWGISAATIAYCSAMVRRRLDDRIVPLMGVLGAFIFAAQMINFSIPATGSSGHLGGGLLLAILLGPHGAFLAIASVLVVQALFFADGGLLALGCNIFNMGFFPAFIAYPLVYRKILGHNPHRFTMATIIAAIVSLQLSALAVVLETCLSGISALPVSTFMLFMQPIHLAIGIVEGLVTVAVVSFLRKARPQLLEDNSSKIDAAGWTLRKVLLCLITLALTAGGLLSVLASQNPDGLEWAVQRVTGKEGLQPPGQELYRSLARMQGKTAFLYNYSLGMGNDKGKNDINTKSTGKGDHDNETGFTGLIGTVITLALSFLAGWLLKRRTLRPGGK
jgi:cobalt/nickel transport system permease protein